MLKRFVGIAILALCCVTMYILSHREERLADEIRQTRQVEYTIKAGDTLFSVLAERVSDSVDVRKYIFLTSKANPCLEPGNLKVGQKIILCLPKE